MSKSQNQTCSDRVVLERYLNEELSEHEEADVQQHISSCPDCQQAMEKIAGDKSIWDGLRDHVTWISDDDEGNDQDERITRLIEYLAPTDDPKMIGRLGTYEVCGIIGQGSTGIVLKALEPALNRFVAIKVMSPLFSSNGAARKRFEREGRAVAAVSHDHVVPIYAVSEFRNLPYIVMKYIPGVSLLQRMQNDGPLDTCEVTRIGLQVSKALEAAHAQGIVHRDVKPANVLLENTVDRAMVTDFGLARVADDASMTRSGTIAGTPQYMSPEQAKGERIDPRSDLFSLGSLMYAACTARPPFRAETVFGVIHRVCNEQPRAIREINPKIDEWLVAFIDKLMEKRADARFQSANVVSGHLASELAYMQSPTTSPQPLRDWLPVQTEPAKQKPAKGLVGFLTLAAVGLLGFAFSPMVQGLFDKEEPAAVAGGEDSEPQTGGTSALAQSGKSRASDDEPVEEPLKDEGEAETAIAAASDEPAPEAEPVPNRPAVEMAPLVGLDGAKVTWKKDEDEWNTSATMVFDQKIEQSFAVAADSKLSVDTDVADVVFRPAEGNEVTVTFMRRVLAESEAQAKQLTAPHHLGVESNDGQLRVFANFERQTPDPETPNEAMTISKGKVTQHHGHLTEKGLEAQQHIKRMLVTIGVPASVKTEVRSVKGDVTVGSLRSSLTAKTARGSIKLAKLEGTARLESMSGEIDASQGVVGNVFAKTTTGCITLADVTGDVEAEAFTGNLRLDRIAGEVNVNTKGGRSIVRDCTGDIDLMTTHGELVLAGATKTGRVRASGGDVLLHQNPGDVYAQTSGGDVYVNGIVGPTSAHSEHGSVYVNVDKTPNDKSRFSSRDGDVAINLAETAAATLETLGNEIEGNTEIELTDKDGKQVGKASLNDGGKLIRVSSTRKIFVNTLPIAELQKEKGLGGSGVGGSGLGGSGLGGSGSAKLKAASEYAIAKSSGEPRPGAIVPVKMDRNGSNIDGYTLYLPESHDTHEGKFGVIVYLQGGYGVGGEVSGINNWGLPRLIRDESDMSVERNKLLLDSFIVVSPHITGGEYHAHPEVVRGIIDTVLTKYKGDESRIYLTGLSSGGHGTWGLASRMPNTFAAISPIASSPEDIVEHGALVSSSIWVAQNTGDRFPHKDIAAAVALIEKEGDVSFYPIDKPRATGTDYLDHRYVFSSPRVEGHDAWTEMYSSVEFYKWLLKQKKQ